jgi:tetratricopeptide (TPR) repeat protein
MPGLFSILRWPSNRMRRGSAWSLDRNQHRAEAQRLLRIGSYAEAQHHLVEAIAEADLRGFSPAKRIRLRLDLAEAERKQVATARPEEEARLLTAAERTARQAIALAAQVSDADAYLLCLDSLSEIFAGQRNWRAVEQTASEALRLGARQTHPDCLRMARRAHLLGVARHWTGKPELAVQALEKALAVQEQFCGPEHLDTARLLSQTGKIYRAQKEHANAQKCLRRALRIHRVVLGESAAEVFEDLHQLAASLEESGDLEGAAQQYEQALMIKGRELGVHNLEPLGEMQFSLANLYVGWGSLSRARELLAEAIGTFRRVGGPRLAVAYETLAQVEESSGRHFSALRELEQAAKVWEKCRPARIRELVRNLEYRADLLEVLRRPRDAAWLRDSARERLRLEEGSLAASHAGG